MRVWWVKGGMLQILLMLTLPLLVEAHNSNVAPVANFRAVAPGLYAGANPLQQLDDQVGIGFLRDLGIHAVVSLQGADADGSWPGLVSRLMHHGERQGFAEVERCAVAAVGMEFHNFPIRSRRPWSESDRQAVEDALAILARGTPAKPVFLHCQRGIDRTGLLIAVYRVRVQGLPAHLAYQEWNESGRTPTARFVTAALDDYFCEHYLTSGPVVAN